MSFIGDYESWGIIDVQSSLHVAQRLGGITAGGDDGGNKCRDHAHDKCEDEDSDKFLSLNIGWETVKTIEFGREGVKSP